MRRSSRRGHCLAADPVTGRLAAGAIGSREAIDPGGARFACRLDFVGVGRGSEVETRQEQWHAFLMERGLVVRHHIFSTEEEALAALAQPTQTLPDRAR